MTTSLPALAPSLDPERQPELFIGITSKRVFAYLIDLVVIALLSGLIWVCMVVLGLLTLGLLFPLLPVLMALVPLAYHTLGIVGPAQATPGMRMMGVRVVSLADQGGGPSLAQALVQTVAFYGSISLTGSLILVVALFNPRRRTLHDWLAGTVVINAPKGL